MREIRHIVIHCSASPNGFQITAQDIDSWHVDRGFRRTRGFRIRQNMDLLAIGYHFVIYVSGIVATGRHLEEVGAHVQGSNARSIGICMIGIDRYTPAQWESLQRLVMDLQKTYPEAEILGHRDFSPDQDGDGLVEPWEWLKTCPGFDVRTWLASGMQPLPENLLQEAA